MREEVVLVVLVLVNHAMPSLICRGSLNVTLSDVTQKHI